MMMFFSINEEELTMKIHNQSLNRALTVLCTHTIFARKSVFHPSFFCQTIINFSHQDLFQNTMAFSGTRIEINCCQHVDYHQYTYTEKNVRYQQHTNTKCQFARSVQISLPSDLPTLDSDQLNYFSLCMSDTYFIAEPENWLSR